MRRTISDEFDKLIDIHILNGRKNYTDGKQRWIGSR
jgi:hypothetical protein